MTFEAKTKKVLTRPVLKFSTDVTHHVRMESKMYIGKEMKQKEGEKKKEPATLVDVIDLETGEPVQLIATAVMKSVLDESYPNNAYVGLCFSITKQARKEGKQYDPYMIIEIEDPAVTANATEGPLAGDKAPDAMVGKAHGHNVAKK